MHRPSETIQKWHRICISSRVWSFPSLEFAIRSDCVSLGDAEVIRTEKWVRSLSGQAGVFSGDLPIAIRRVCAIVGSRRHEDFPVLLPALQAIPHLPGGSEERQRGRGSDRRCGQCSAPNRKNSVLARAATAVRAATSRQQTCKVGLESLVLRTERALPVGPVEGLDQDQEP
jgi:hypothetical protein